jgi:hypothetical protein
LGPLWIVGLVALLCGILLAPGEASKEFYSAIAGTIPVLLLTLAVQARFFELPTMAQARAQFATLLRKPGEAAVLYLPSVVIDAVENATPRWRFIERILFGVALLALLMVGEFAALHPLATGVPADGNPRLISASIAAGFSMVAGLALVGGIETRGLPGDTERPSDSSKIR